jgi:hypothetical protein
VNITDYHHTFYLPLKSRKFGSILFCLIINREAGAQGFNPGNISELNS